MTRLTELDEVDPAEEDMEDADDLATWLGLSGETTLHSLDENDKKANEVKVAKQKVSEVMRDEVVYDYVVNRVEDVMAEFEVIEQSVTQLAGSFLRASSVSMQADNRQEVQMVSQAIQTTTATAALGTIEAPKRAYARMAPEQEVSEKMMALTEAPEEGIVEEDAYIEATYMPSRALPFRVNSRSTHVDVSLQALAPLVRQVAGRSLPEKYAEYTIQLPLPTENKDFQKLQQAVHNNARSIVKNYVKSNARILQPAVVQTSARRMRVADGVVDSEKYGAIGAAAVENQVLEFKKLRQDGSVDAADSSGFSFAMEADVSALEGISTAQYSQGLSSMDAEAGAVAFRNSIVKLLVDFVVGELLQKADAVEVVEGEGVIEESDVLEAIDRFFDHVGEKLEEVRESIEEMREELAESRRSKVRRARSRRNDAVIRRDRPVAAKKVTAKVEEVINMSDTYRALMMTPDAGEGDKADHPFNELYFGQEFSNDQEQFLEMMLTQRQTPWINWMIKHILLYKKSSAAHQMLKYLSEVANQETEVQKREHEGNLADHRYYLMKNHSFLRTAIFQLVFGRFQRQNVEFRAYPKLLYEHMLARNQRQEPVTVEGLPS